MKFNINRPPADIRKSNKISAKQEWHTKFAWLPTTVDETDDSYSKVWFEKYWRRGHWGPSRMGEASPIIFTKYSEKEYFKKKLGGDFDKEETKPYNVTNVGSGAVSAVTSINKILTKGGPYDNNKYKRYVIGGDEVAPGVTTGTYIVGGPDEDDENGKEL